MIYFLLLIGLIILFVWLRRKFKTPVVGSMVCVTGGVKSGKSTFSLHLAYKQYKKNRRAVIIRNWFCKIFNKPLFEVPLFYSTVPVSFPHVLLTEELLTRKTRFAYKSVIWVDEASLLADSQYYKDVDINDKLMLFNKLIAHETKGGTLVYNTQSVQDLHYSVKRCLSETFYVHNTVKWIPFFLLVTVREERYSEDGTVINSYNEDVEQSLQRVIIPKSIWKKFDCYCYSTMTDGLDVDKNVVTSDNLKAKRILSFNPRHSGEFDGKGGFKHEKKNG